MLFTGQGVSWHEQHGSWWMLQWWRPWHGISLGVHVDPTPKTNSVNGERYGPYVDLHLGCVMVSLGRNPVWSSEVGCHLGRGGDRAG